MRRITKVLLTVILLLSVFTGCSDNEKSINEMYTSIELEKYLLKEDFQAFNGMLKEGTKLTEEKFKSLSNIASSQRQATFTKMEIIEYENGEMILVFLTVEEGNVKINDIKVIPPQLSGQLKSLMNRD
jgi:hypothetical protein